MTDDLPTIMLHASCPADSYPEGEALCHRFGRLAQELINTFNPSRLFDMACTHTLLVEAMRDRGVAAWGRSSAIVIGQARPDVRAFFSEGCFTSSISDHFDLITCIGVLELMSAQDQLLAIRQISAATDRVVFSSATPEPSDHAKPAINLPLHWMQAFSRYNFWPAMEFMIDSLPGLTIVFERRERAPNAAFLAGCARIINERLEAKGLKKRIAILEQQRQSALLGCEALKDRISRISSERTTLQLEIAKVKHSHDHAVAKSRQAVASLNDALAARDAALAERELALEERTKAIYERELATERYKAITNSIFWRSTRPFREVAKKIPVKFRLRARKMARAVVHALLAGRQLEPQSYQDWIQQYDTLSGADLAAITAHLGRLEYRPLISIIMPAFETPEWALRAALQSIRDQLYPDWELCVVDDASVSRHVSATLEEIGREDQRIRWVRREENGHISIASNTALALARGDFVALMDHDDVLAPHALYEVVCALNEKPYLDVIYSDEDQIDSGGLRHSPYFKTEWNPELFLGHNMISHLGVYRRTLVESVGRFREGFEGSQDYDLALRCVAATCAERIHHIPAVLYHWRRAYGEPSFSDRQLQTCRDAAIWAVSDYLRSKGQAAAVVSHPNLPQWTRVLHPLPVPLPLVSVIIPTRDQPELLERCLAGLLHQTDYSALEVIVVDHMSVLPRTRELLAQVGKDRRVRVLSFEGEFNYAAINNMAASHANGSILALLNNDVEIIRPDWLKELVSYAVQLEVGAVGARLLYPNNKVQHAGVVLGVGGVANHVGHLLDRSDPGYFGRSLLTSDVSAVTGACLVVRTSVYWEVNGLDELHLKVAFNDVDFCLRLQKLGYRNIYNSHAELYHHESATRGAEDTPEKLERFKREVSYMLSRWKDVLTNDPFYSPNMSLSIDRVFQLAFPSRRKRPWTGSSVES